MPGQCRLMTIDPRSTFTKSQSWQQKTWPQHHDRHQPPTPVETISSKVKIGVDNLHFTINNNWIPKNGAFKCQTPLLLLRSNSTKSFIGLATLLDAMYLHMSLAIENLRINLSCVWSERELETYLKEISGGSQALGKICQELYYNVAKEEKVSSRLGMKSQPNAASENRINRINIYPAGNRETQSCHFI